MRRVRFEIAIEEPSWNFGKTRYGHNKAAYKIIGCKVLRSRAEMGTGQGWRRRAKRIAWPPSPRLRKSCSRLHDRKFLRIFYCVTIFMVIVIINLLGLFMPRARIKGGLWRGRREDLGRGRKGCYSSRHSAFERRSEIAARKSERR